MECREIYAGVSGLVMHFALFRFSMRMHEGFPAGVSQNKTPQF